MNNKIKRITGIVLALMMIFTMAAGAEVEKLVINQIIQKGNDVNLYVSAMDKNDAVSSESLPADSFSVKMNDATIQPEDIARFGDTGDGIAYTFCVDISGSVTSSEEEQIRQALGQFIASMGGRDYARIITIGEQITVVCEFTQDAQALNASLSSIHNNDNKTYLYEGISFALDSSRKSIAGMPERSVIMVFTDGMDDSDGSMGDDELMINCAVSRIPVYITALKGNDKNADLSLISRISRNSGGVVYSYSDYSITDALAKFHNDMNGGYVLHARPEYDAFGQSNINWKVVLTQPNYTVSSATYVYSLGMDGVIDTRATPTPAPVTPEPTAEAMTPTLPPISTATEVPVSEETAQPAVAADDGSISILEWALGVWRAYPHIVIAGVLVLLAVIILIIVLVASGKNRKKKKKKPAYDDDKTEYEEPPVVGEDEKTFCDDEEIDNFGEKTFFEDNPSGPLVELEIHSEGQTVVREVILSGDVHLGRSEACKQQCRFEIKDNHVSRTHAVLFNRVDGIYVRDEGSSRGTFLNGLPVHQPMTIHNGDVLKLGDGTTSIRINILHP